MRKLWNRLFADRIVRSRNVYVRPGCYMQVHFWRSGIITYSREISL